MGTFRSGFKIIGELTLRQTFGRVRSFSEDRKPGSWLPEDQWAVRPPCTTCPDPCAPKKPPKPSKSWLSICKDPEPPIPCDIRHNNCPPPQKNDEPWYAFLTKKKPAKPIPPLNACRMEAQREAENPTEEYCEDIEDNTWPVCYEQAETHDLVCPERPPAPVIRLSCPPPKDLDLMLWCGRPGISVARIAAQCQSDRMPYEEFRPKKCWKPLPFSLPVKNEAPPHQPFCSNIGRAPLSEYKQVDIPKPLYTRYKSVELEDENFLLCMTDARCPNETHTPSLAIQPPPLQKPQLPPNKSKPKPCPEKSVLEAASRKPVKLKCAPKFKFRPKPTKLVERRQYRNPCAQHNTCDLKNIQPPTEFKTTTFDSPPPCDYEVPKVITGTLTSEPQTYQRNTPSRKPPHWMFMLSKPGSKDTPLIPHSDPYPREPDWCGETDGLKFYDGQDEGIYPKPPPDPCRRVANMQEVKPPPLPPCPPPPPEAPPTYQEKFVLMPESFNIRNMRPKEELSEKKLQEASFQEFIDAKTAHVRTCSKLYPQMKENILYDLVRNCPLPPFDPMKADPPPRRPPEPECPQPMRFYYRRYSTFGPLHLRKPNYAKVLNRLNSEDSSDKCKPRKLVPKPKDCPPPPKGLSCNETELPCCPKAKIPPRCDVKRPLPPCKKKLAPKPSYSECSKDPPPCPRITECNAWEKREMENQRKGPSKGRRFSSWAHDQENISEEKGSPLFKTAYTNPKGSTAPAPGPSYSEYLDLKDRGQSLNKNTRSSHKQRKIFSGKELMLNFVNPTEDTNSYYKPDNLVRRGKPQWRKLKSAQSKTKKSDTSLGNQVHERKVIDALLQDHHTRNDARFRNPGLNETEPSFALSTSVQENTSKAIVGSIGSWINALMKAHRARSESCPPTLGKMNRPPTTTYVETVDVDRIMKLTKPFGRNFKSHSYENLFYTPVDSGIREQKKIPSPFRRVWGRNRNRSFTVFPKFRRDRARSSLWKFEFLSPGCDLAPSTIPGRSNLTKMVRNSVGDCSIQTLKQKKDLFTKLDFQRSDKQSLPIIENLGRMIHLNVRGNENQRSLVNSSSKNGLKCYKVGNSPTTYLNAVDWNKIASETVFLRRTISRYSVTSRGGSALSKIKEPKFLAQSKRTETSASTDFVQNLIKKVKVSRPPPQKKRGEPESLVDYKTKFRQSATSSMVASVLAKKESDSGKLIQLAGTDKALMPLALPNKTWICIDRASDTNTKYDFKKAILHATVTKSKPKKWLQEADDFPSDTRSFLYGGKKKNKSRENLVKEDLKYCTDKYIKRQEVKNILSKLELKKKVPKVSEKPMKLRYSEPTRKDILQILDHPSSSNTSDKAIGRFSWQHALFKSTNKPTPSKSVIEYAVEPIRELKSLIDIKEAGPKVLKTTISEGYMPKKPNNNVELYDSDIDVVQCVQPCDKKKVEYPKRQNVKDVSFKHWKDTKDFKVKCFTHEKLSAVEPRPMTSAVARAPKCLHAGLHTRKYTTKSPDKTTLRSDRCGCRELEDTKDNDKRKQKDCECSSNKSIKSKKRANREKGREDSDDFSCRSDKVKKPGPNCPDG